ncbi:hypothetical protein ES703_39818 [subsurface metagenome]
MDLDIGGKVWFWDIIDAKTRFLLASHMSKTRTIKDARKLMELAAKRAGKTPKAIITDRLLAYLDGIELTFGADTKHIQGKPFSVENNTNLIERFHGSLKSRTKVMRGLKDIKTAKLITDGWLLYYNYLRPHEALNDKTPAQVAGVRFPYRNWKDIVAERKAITPKQVSATSTLVIPELAKPPKRALIRKRLVKRRKPIVRKQPSLSGIRV